MKNATRIVSLFAVAAAGLLIGCSSSTRSEGSTSANVKSDCGATCADSKAKAGCCGEAKSASGCTESKASGCTDAKAKN